MQSRIALVGLAVAGGLIVAGQLHESQAVADRSGSGGAVAGGGADVAICVIPNAMTHQRIDDTHAFAIATTAWNAGNEVLLWQANNTNHPVIAQNLYRLKDGRIEMIGMAWLKHGFCAVQQFQCGNCQFTQGCPQFLNPGCSDPYDAFLNSLQSGMGPRSEVNASTGEFLYPWVLGWNQTGNSVYKRLQVRDEDLTTESGAFYFAEAHYVHPQEGTSDARHNNAGYRRFNLSTSGNTYNLTGSFPTTPQPAIYAWQANVQGVQIEVIDVPGEPVDGRFHLGYRVFDNGDGTWRYEYALHNMNSHRSARGFSVPLPSDVNVSSTFYRDVKYHSGEVFTDEPWALDISPGSAISWTGVSYEVNPNANALRWSSMFNFAFVADAPPVEGEVVIELFRPGTPTALAVPALVPEGDTTKPCPGDLTGSGSVGVPDLLALLGCWGPVAPGCEAADLTESRSIGVPDLLVLLGNWGPCK